jgi:photosystem II stability/assembly factor-like uncharacterized protein
MEKDSYSSVNDSSCCVRGKMASVCGAAEVGTFGDLNIQTHSRKLRESGSSSVTCERQIRTVQSTQHRGIPGKKAMSFRRRLFRSRIDRGDGAMKAISLDRFLMIVCFLVAEQTSFSQSIVWQRSSVGIGDTAVVTSFASNSQGQIFAGGGASGLYRSSDNGLTWAPLTLKPTNFGTRAIAIDSSGWIFLGGDFGVSRSTDNGVNWTRKNVGFEDTLFSHVTSLVVNHNGYIFAAVEQWGLYRSTNRGDSWQPCAKSFQSLTVTCLVNDSWGNLYVGTQSVFRYGGFFVSNNNGDSWTGPMFWGKTVTSAVVNSAGIVLVATQIPWMLYRWTNLGLTWDTLSTNAQICLLGVNSSDHLFGIAPRNPPDIGRYTSGVLKSTDKGSSWVSLNQGLPDTTSIVSMFVAPNGYVFLGTSGQGIYRSSQRTTSVAVYQSTIAAFSLGQNYPNPFNPSTTIRYELTTPAFVSMNIFNTLGQEVALLVNEQKAAGIYQIRWNPSNVPSGIYFCRLQARQTNGGQAGEFTQTKKLVLVR